MRRLALLGAAVLLAGCGSAATTRTRTVRPHLPRALAHEWARQADAVAAALASRDGCLAQQRATALRAAVLEAEQRVGARFQEPLTAAVNDLVDRITCTPPAPPEPQAPAQHGHGKGKGHHEGHGKHKEHD